ncbi:MAG: inositol monophosphatase family protein [Alphaproteobacteria bacterium]
MIKVQEIVSLVYECGDILRSASVEVVYNKNNNSKNLLTDYDLKIQEMLQSGLYKIMPEASFLGEEGEQYYNKEGFCFVCDPIDGTTNFVMGYRGSGISVALLKEGKPVLGVIYNPYLDEMYVAEIGKGATCNGEKITTKDKRIKDSVVIFGTGGNRVDEVFDLAKDYFKKGIDIRRFGAAVIDLTNVARGSAAMFFELYLNPWDYCAGALIVNEAGGVVLTEDGNILEDYFAQSTIFAFASKEEAEKYVESKRLCL